MNLSFEIVKLSRYFNIEGGEPDANTSFALNYCMHKCWNISP